MAESTTAPSPLQLNEVFQISVGTGAIYGFLEGVADLTVQHMNAPALAPILFLIGTGSFVLGGILLWLLAQLLPQSWRRPVVLFVLRFTAAFGLVPLLTPHWMPRTVRVMVPVLLVVLTWAFWDGLERAFARRLWLWVVVIGGLELAVAGLSMVASAQGTPWEDGGVFGEKSPNVLLVMVDALRADHLSCYGYWRQTSPTIDRLARQGVLFETAIAPSAWTPPATASILTGTYPHSHGVEHGVDELPARFPTLAEQFRKNGYETAAFSADSFGFAPRTGMDRGFAVFDDYFLNLSTILGQESLLRTLNNRLVALGLVKNLWGQPRAEDINRAVWEWLDRVPSSRPVFLTVKYFDVHDPYQPPQPWRHRFSTKPDPGQWLRSGTYYSHRPFPRLSAEQLQDVIAAYDGAIAYVDAALGDLLDGLKRRGLLENTLVVITADHGEMLGEHGLYFHGAALWLPVIRVPLIFWWPARLPAGRRISVPVSTRDLGATVLHLLGRQVPSREQSLDSLWQPHVTASGWPLPLSELAQQDFYPEGSAYWGPLVSIVSPQFHYIVDPRQGPLLFDWKQDPGEEHNLIADPAYASTAAALKATLERELRGGP
jgi:arylsulfatase A-like enzyme